jgi:hypothetical protein
VGQQANLPKWGSSGSWSWSPVTEDSNQNWIAPPFWWRSWPNRVAVEGQCSYCLVIITTALPTLNELSELPQLPIAICSVHRRNQILLISQSPGETTWELQLVCQYQE